MRNSPATVSSSKSGIKIHQHVSSLNKGHSISNPGTRKNMMKDPWLINPATPIHDSSLLKAVIK